jgi:hypothetical protein
MAMRETVRSKLVDKEKNKEEIEVTREEEARISVLKRKIESCKRRFAIILHTRWQRHIRRQQA